VALVSPAAKVEQAPGEVVTSEAVDIQVENATGTLTLSGDASALYSLNGGAFTASSTALSNGTQSLRLRVTSGSAAGAVVKAVVTVGEKTAEFSVTTRSDVTAPVASVLFPPAVSLTEGASTVIRGTVKDEGTGASGVKAVSVNGIAATINAEKGTWELINASLNADDNTLNVETEDTAGNKNTAAASVKITKGDITQAFPASGGVDFVGPQTVAWDNLDGRNRALVMDVSKKALMTVDLATGVRAVLSDNTTQADLPFVYDRTDYNGSPLVIDKVKKSLYTTTAKATGRTELQVVGLADGKRILVVGGLGTVSDLALQKSDKFYRIFEADASEGIMTMWDFDRSERVAYSDPDGFVPDNLNPFSNAGSVVIDSPRQRLLMTSLTGSQFVYSINAEFSQVDVANEKLRGARSIFSNATTPNSFEPFTANGTNVLTSIRIDADRSRALMVDRLKPALFALTLSDDKTQDGARSILSDNTKQPSNKLVDPYGVHIEAGMPFALLVDKGQKAVLAVDLETGERVFVSKSAN
jgi:hypothetical protein